MKVACTVKRMPYAKVTTCLFSQLLVNPQVLFSSNSGSSIFVGQNITLTCNVTGRLFREVRLQKEGRPIFSKRFRRRVSSWYLSYNITNITNTDEGCYSCVAYVFAYEGNGMRIFFHVKGKKDFFAHMYDCKR